SAGSQRGAGETLADNDIERAKPGDGVAGCVVERQQLVPDVVGVGHGLEPDRADRRALPVAVDRDEGDVDAVDRGAGDHAQTEIAHWAAPKTRSLKLARVGR